MMNSPGIFESTLGLAAVIFLCTSCSASGPSGPSQVEERTDQPQASQPPAVEASPASRLARPCASVESRHKVLPVGDLELSITNRPVRIAPPGTHYGFAQGGSVVLYVRPKGGTLYAVSPDSGSPRPLTRPAKYWFESEGSGHVIVDSGGALFRVDPSDGTRQEADDILEPIEQQRRQQQALAAAGYGGAYPIPVSERWLAGVVGPSAEESQLVVLDQESNEARIASLDSHRLLWNPRAMPNGRAVAYIARAPERLFIADFPTGEIRCVSAPNKDRIVPFFAGSTDAGHIAYARYSKGSPQERNYELHVADVERGIDTRIDLADQAYTFVAKAVPDPAGKHDRPRFVIGIQYASRDKMAFFLIEGTEVHRLTAELPGWSNFYVSPNGAWLLFEFGAPARRKTPEPGLTTTDNPAPKKPARDASPEPTSPGDTEPGTPKSGLYILALP